LTKFGSEFKVDIMVRDEEAISEIVQQIKIGTESDQMKSE